MLCSNCNGSVSEKEPHASFKLFIKSGCSAEVLLCSKCLKTDYWKYDRLIKKAESIIGQNFLAETLNNKDNKNEK